MIRSWVLRRLLMFFLLFWGALTVWANGQQELAPSSSVLKTLRILGQAGHGAEICAVAYNDDASLMVTGDVAGAVIVWRTTDYLQTHRFFGTGKWASALAFSHDSRYLAVATPITLRVIDLVANKIVHEQPASDDHWVWHLSFGATRDELFAVTSPTAYSQQYSWNLEGFRTATKALQVFHPFSRQWSATRQLGTAIPKSLYASPENGWVSVGFSSGVATRFRSKDLVPIDTQSVPGSVEGVGETSDGQWRAVSSEGLFDLSQGKAPVTLAAVRLSNQDGDKFGPISFSTRGNRVALPLDDHSVVLLDSRDGSVVRKTRDFSSGREISGTAAGIQPDQILVAQSGPMHLVTPDGRQLVLNDAISPRGGILADQHDRKILFSGDSRGDDWGQSGRLGSVDFAALRVTLSRTNAPPSTLSKITDADATGYALANSDSIRFGHGLLAWAGRPELAFRHPSPEVRVSPDGRFVYAFDKDKRAVLQYSVGSNGVSRNGQVLWKVNDDSPRVWLDATGKTLLIKDRGDAIVLSTATGKPLYVAKDAVGTGALAVSADGRFLFLPNAQSKSLELIDLTQGRVTSRQEVSEETMYMFDSPTRAAVSSNGDRVALANGKGLFVYSTRDWSLVREFPMSSNEGEGTFLFAWDDSVILHADDGGVLNVGNLITGSLVHVRMTDQDWLFYTDDGYFEGSSNSGRMLAVIQGGDAYGMDQLAAKFNRPDILMERLGTTKVNPELYSFFRANFQKRLARMGLTEGQVDELRPLPVAQVLRTAMDGDKATLELSFDGLGEQLARFTVYVNDVPLFGQGGKELEGSLSTATVGFDLIPGENKVEVSCFNAAGAESLRVLRRVTGPPVRTVLSPRLFYLGFGVSKYANADLNLRYADKDALDLEAAFGKASGGRYSQVVTKTFTNEQVNLQTMTLAKSFLAQARPQDTVILFIAGHGVFTQGSATPDYYYLAHNTDVKNLETTAIRFAEVEDLLQGLPSRQKLFLMDTCNSGEVDPLVGAQVASASTATTPRAVRGLTVKSVAPPAATPRSWLLEKGRYSQNDLIRRSGAIVFSSSKGGEYSYESDEIGNGMFTSAILQVLDGRLSAETNPDGTIGVRSLVDAVAHEVPHMTSEMQHPGVDRDNLSVNFTLPVVDANNPRRELKLRLLGLPVDLGTDLQLKFGRTDGDYEDSQATVVNAFVGPQGYVDTMITWFPTKGLTVQLVDGSGVPIALARGVGNDQARGHVVEPIENVNDLVPDGDTLVIDASHRFATLTLNGQPIVSPSYLITFTVRGLVDAAGQTVRLLGAQGKDQAWVVPELDLDDTGSGSTEVRLEAAQDIVELRSNFVEFASLTLPSAARKALNLDTSNTVTWDLSGPSSVLTINGRKVP